MKQMEVETIGVVKRKGVNPPPPPPPLPPLPRCWITAKKAIMHSVTKQEIAQFWRQKHMVEEDHLLSALKAAARLRARNLTEEDYKYFEESLKENHSKDEGGNDNNNNNNDKDDKELRVGIKDWWTKSKYAYLNQPAIESDKPKRTSTYIPNFCLWKAPPPQSTSSLGVF